MVVVRTVRTVCRNVFLIARSRSAAERFAPPPHPASTAPSSGGLCPSEAPRRVIDGAPPTLTSTDRGQVRVPPIAVRVRQNFLIDTRAKKRRNMSRARSCCRPAGSTGATRLRPPRNVRSRSATAPHRACRARRGARWWPPARTRDGARRRPQCRPYGTRLPDRRQRHEGGGDHRLGRSPGRPRPLRCGRRGGGARANAVGAATQPRRHAARHRDPSRRGRLRTGRARSGRPRRAARTRRLVDTTRARRGTHGIDAARPHLDSPGRAFRGARARDPRATGSLEPRARTTRPAGRHHLPPRGHTQPQRRRGSCPGGECDPGLRLGSGRRARMRLDEQCEPMPRRLCRPRHGVHLITERHMLAFVFDPRRSLGSLS